MGFGRIIKFMFVMVLWATALNAQDLVAGKDGSLRNVDTRAMLSDNGEMYIATRNEIYHSSDPKGKWESVFSLPAGANEINCLGGSARTIFAGTRRGLLRSQDYGRTWKNVFRTIIPEKNNVLSIATAGADARRVIISTEKGVFLSDNGGEGWQDISANLRNGRVRYAALINGSMYACADDGLYVSGTEPAGGWERLYVRSITDQGGGTDRSDDASGYEQEMEENDLGPMVNCIAYKGKRLYIGVGKNVFYSDDDGNGWKSFPSEGIAGLVNYIRVPVKSEKLCCATTKGVYTFDEGNVNGAAPRWREAYKGTDKIFNVNSLVYGDETEKTLWAITDNGLYKMEWAPDINDQYVDVERNIKTLKVAYDNEPPFKELQQAAMKFAEVDPDKIAQWRKEARLRALVPKFSIGIDQGRSTNTEIYTSATSKYAVVGPDDFNDGWDLSVSWELADLIWSGDQTNIDVRSRLTTQLRNDILDDLRRVYFERKRLQFEMMANPPQDPKFRYEKELRIQELTQAIDDLTGNYLSENINKDTKNNKNNNPKNQIPVTTSGE